MKLATSLILALSGALAGNALAANWVDISPDPKNGIRHYVDSDSIERNLGSVMVWRMLDYPASQRQRVNQQVFASQRVQTEFDCAARAMRQVSSAWHAAPMGGGALLQETRDADDWQIDQFDALTLPVWQIACGQFDR